MKKISLAKKNAFILVMTLLPFIFGILFSLHKSNDMEEFGIAINISGSQRMRTMLISNVVQSIEDFKNEGNSKDLNQSVELLLSELETYEIFMDALLYGNLDLSLSPNKYPTIISKIEDYEALYKEYLIKAKEFATDYTLSEHVDFVVEHSIDLKNGIHLVVQEYQKQYDLEVLMQKRLNTIILFISIILTILGLNLTKKLQENENDATYDFLTGLKTRKIMFKEANKKKINKLNLFFIDLDKFKEINDTYGHLVGDDILIEATKRFTDTFGYDNVYRYAGDEFIIMVECDHDQQNKQISCSNVSQAIKELKTSFSKPFIDSNLKEHQLGFSCGIVTKNAEIDNIVDLINLADDLMYDSKNFASHVIICDSKDNARNRINLKQKAKMSIKDGQIVPYLQPIYNIYKDELVGFEMLARWELDGVVYTPMEFLPIFKRSGLMEELDAFMISNIEIVFATIAQRLGKPYKLTLHVNISNDTLLNPDSDRLVGIMESISVPLEQLVFELNDKVTDMKRLNRNLRKLKHIGCYFTMNDYSKDNQLFELINHNFISHVRIDRQVVSMLDEEDDHDFLKEMVDYVHHKDKICIGEGVETLKQFNILRSFGIRHFQGFLFYEPMPIYEIDNIIKTFFNKVKWRKFS